MGSVRFIIWCCLCLLVVGCGFPQAKLDEARGHVDLALSAWKKGDKPDSLQSLPQPITFGDTLWSKGYLLTDYEIQKTHYHDQEQMIRCDVMLSLKTPGPKVKELKEPVVFNVTLGPPIKIEVNPMP